jgi:hypothetical protein
VKAPVNLLGASNVALSGLQTIDGVTLIANNRVLLVGQTNPVENGAWLAQSGAWTRPTDFNTGQQAEASYFLVLQGTTYANTSFVSTTPLAIIGTDPLTFVQFSAAFTVSGINDGSGQGLVYSTTVGTTLHFRSLLQQNFVTITNNTNDISIGVNASSANLPSTLVARDGSGNFAANQITATVIGSASLNLLLTGGVLTGSLQVQNGTASVPSLQIGSAAVGLSQSGGSLQLSTNSTLALSIDSVGNVTLASLNSSGVVHTSSLGLLTTSLIVNADITVGTISNDRLATINTNNVANTIVVRDVNGNFAAGLITADLNGTVTGTLVGHATLDLALTGGTLSGNLLVPAGSGATPSLQIGSSDTGLSQNTGSLQFSTAGSVGMKLSSGGTLQLLAYGTGLVHSGSSGILTSSLLVNADITVGTIANDKLATATSSNVASSVVLRDASGNFAANIITATLNGSATGSLPLTGGTMLGNILMPTGSAAVPCLQIGLAGVGFSEASGALQLSTNATLAMSISSAGAVQINNLTTLGLVHSSSIGVLTSSLLVDADITVGTIANDKLATASSSNVLSSVVLRDGSGNFAANIITASVSGHASLDLALTGGTMIGNILMPVGSAAVPSLQIGLAGVGFSEVSGALQFSTNGALAMNISSAGVVQISNLTTLGLVHSSASGILTSSLLVDADITVGTIANNKLVTLSTAGLVANSATTATSSNTASTIVARDASGNFAAGTVTATAVTTATIDSATTVSVGPTTATSVLLGRSGQTVQAVGTFFMVVPKGSWYSTSSYSPAFSAGVARLTPPTAASSGPLVQFVSISPGVFSYTGSRSHTFSIAYNITFTTGPNGSNMLFFNSINGSTTISSTQTQVGRAVNNTNNARQTSITLTDLVVMNNSDTIQLGARCAIITSAVSFDLISFNIKAEPD